MRLNYRARLFMILFIAALILLTTITISDYKRLQKQTEDNSKEQIKQATETVLFALNSIDRAYHYMDQEIGIEMEEQSKALQKKYKKDKDFSKWDFDELSEDIGMDIYILNDKNKIIHSNIEEDVGIEFDVCCITLNDILHERRETGGIFIDGIDREQETGEAKKYSYATTPDKKYLIELGFSLKNELLYQNFNFTSVTESVVTEFPLIEDVTVLNYGGKPYGEVEPEDKPKVRRDAFESVRETKEVEEVEQKIQGITYTYRYIPYESENDMSSTQTKVVEVMYNNEKLHSEVRNNLKKMIMQYLLYTAIIGLVAYVLARLLAKPLQLAYYDRLTNLKNRASFEKDLAKYEKKQEANLSIFLVDIDRFKSINASLGREKSNTLLQVIAKSLTEFMKDREGEVYTFGSDTFIVVMKNMDERDAEYVAPSIISQLDKDVKEQASFSELEIYISIGVALARDESELLELFEHAELALIKAKQNEENEFHIYKEEEN